MDTKNIAIAILVQNILTSEIDPYFRQKSA